jgi:L-serine dehydratase
VNGKSIFDIIGPVMIGPSSSHTAGAVKIGNVARSVLGEKPVAAQIVLYGSFAKTYSGHGTDRALVAGLMGMASDNPDIKKALTLADGCGLTVKFLFGEDVNDYHPNTASIALRGISSKEIFVMGSSVGGGEVIVTQINQYLVNIKGHGSTLLIEHADRPGVIGNITTILGSKGINISEMQVVRSESDNNQMIMIEADQPMTEPLLQLFSCLPNVITVSKIQIGGEMQ